MKDILKQIIESNFKKNSDLSYQLKLDNELLIIKNKDGEASDFFYFIFQESENFENLNSEILYKKLVEGDTNKEFSVLDQFEKNLNFIYFIKVSGEDYKELPEKFKEKAYQIEEDKFYAKEKVIFYTYDLIEKFTNDSLDIFGIKEVNEKMNDDTKFLLDLVIGLTFIKIDFGDRIGKVVENNVFEESFNSLDKELVFEINKKNIKSKIFTQDENEFREKVEKINDINNKQREDNVQIDINNKKLTPLEENLLSLFGEGKTELESELLSFKYIENEDK